MTTKQTVKRRYETGRFCEIGKARLKALQVDPFSSTANVYSKDSFTPAICGAALE